MYACMHACIDDDDDWWWQEYYYIFVWRIIYLLKFVFAIRSFVLAKRTTRLLSPAADGFNDDDCLIIVY